MNKKYELTNISKIAFGRKIYRIIAIKDFNNVKKGDIGGYVESEYNLSHEDICWIYGDAVVFGDAGVSDDALVYGNALVYDNAVVYGNARVFGDAGVSDDAYIESNDDYSIIYNFGSKNRIATFFKCKDDTIKVNCGGFYGTINEFREKVKTIHKDNKYAKEYLMIADLMELKING